MVPTASGPSIAAIAGQGAGPPWPASRPAVSLDSRSGLAGRRAALCSWPAGGCRRDLLSASTRKRAPGVRVRQPQGELTSTDVMITGGSADVCAKASSGSEPASPQGTSSAVGSRFPLASGVPLATTNPGPTRKTVQFAPGLRPDPETYAIPNLAPATRDVYIRLWEKHLEPRVGTYQLRELTPAVIAALRVSSSARSARPPSSRPWPSSRRSARRP
jgi:hypothetical protein